MKTTLVLDLRNYGLSYTIENPTNIPRFGDIVFVQTEMIKKPVHLNEELFKLAMDAFVHYQDYGDFYRVEDVAYIYTDSDLEIRVFLIENELFKNKFPGFRKEITP